MKNKRPTRWSEDVQLPHGDFHQVLHQIKFYAVEVAATIVFLAWIIKEVPCSARLLTTILSPVNLINRPSRAYNTFRNLFMDLRGFPCYISDMAAARNFAGKAPLATNTLL